MKGLRRLMCRVLGHRWLEMHGMNVDWTFHARPTYELCRRCRAERPLPAPSSESPRPTSSSSPFRRLDPEHWSRAAELRAASRERRAGSADTEVDAPPDTRLAYSLRSAETSSTTAEITPEYVYRTGASS